MSRNIRIGLFLTTLASVGLLLYFFDITAQLHLSDEPESEDAFLDPAPPLYAPTDPPFQVRIFFPARSNDILLRSRTLTIFASESVENRARQIVEHLVAGADDDLIFGRLPEDTRLNQVFVSADGTAYLDFSNALSDNHPGGILPELATIYAIVNSLTFNLPEIDRVKILIGGAERETLAGHSLLIAPLGPDLSVTDISPALIL